MAVSCGLCQLPSSLRVSSFRITGGWIRPQPAAAGRTLNGGSRLRSIPSDIGYGANRLAVALGRTHIGDGRIRMVAMITEQVRITAVGPQ